MGGGALPWGPIRVCSSSWGWGGRGCPGLQAPFAPGSYFISPPAPTIPIPPTLQHCRILLTPCVRCWKWPGWEPPPYQQLSGVCSSLIIPNNRAGIQPFPPPRSIPRAKPFPDSEVTPTAPPPAADSGP